MALIALSLRLSYPSTDLPVGLLFALVFCSAMFAAVRAIVDRSHNRIFCVGYFIICVACWLASHSEPPMKANTLPHHVGVPLLRMRTVSPASGAQSNEMYYQMIRVLCLGSVPILGILGGAIARGCNVGQSQN